MKRARHLRLLIADRHGALHEHPSLCAVGSDGAAPRIADASDFVPLDPDGGVLMLPGRRPVGLDPASGRLEVVERLRAGGRSIECFAVAAFAPVWQTRTLLPAYESLKGAPVLPLYAYAAAAAAPGGRVLVAAERTDWHEHWNGRHYNTPELDRRIRAALRALPGNRIALGLARCAAGYRCRTAQNLFYRRWEAAAPVSPSCNARCLGCLSLQHKGCAAAAQNRIGERPSAAEIVALGAFHLEGAARPMISFGQGCEGEPLLEAGLIGEAIRALRRRTRRGRIHMNTNGGRPTALAALAGAGLQGARIALNSARAPAHAAYFRPRDFSLADVEASIRIAVEAGCITSINLLVFPGVTDRPDELDAAIRLLRRTRPHMVQLRSLCMDPERYLAAIGPAGAGAPIGMRKALDALRQAVPGVRFGNFNELPR